MQLAAVDVTGEERRNIRTTTRRILAGIKKAKPPKKKTLKALKKKMHLERELL